LAVFIYANDTVNNILFYAFQVPYSQWRDCIFDDLLLVFSAVRQDTSYTETTFGCLYRRFRCG